MKSMLIIGIDSAIGSYLKVQFENQNWVVLGTSRNKAKCSATIFYLDLIHPDLFFIPDTIKIDAVIFSASIGSYKVCDADSSLCEQVNYLSQIQIALYLQKHFDPFMIFLSSTAVFDGSVAFQKENAIQNPVSVYGISKMKAEKHLQDCIKQLAILRITKVFHINYSLIKNWIMDLNNHTIIHPLMDLTASPVSIQFVFKAVNRLIQLKKTGTYHLSGCHDVVYCELAMTLAEKIGADKKYIVGINGIDVVIPRKWTQKYTSLDMTLSQQDLSLFPQSHLDVFSDILYG